MHHQQSHPTGRLIVSVVASVALLTALMASPGAAINHPANTNTLGLLKGGYISLGEDKQDPDHLFPLGEKDGESNVCDKTEDQRSHVLADDIDASGNSNNLEFHFAQGTSGIKDTILGTPVEVCVQLEVKNSGLLVIETDGKDVSIHVPPKMDNVGPAVEVSFIVKNQNNGSVIAQCAVNVQLPQLIGEWSNGTPLPDKVDPDWDLIVGNDHDNPEKKITVPAVDTGQCSPFLIGPIAGAAINDALDLSPDGRDDGNIELFFSVYDCNVHACGSLV